LEISGETSAGHDADPASSSVKNDSSPRVQPPARFRFVLPSVGDLIFVLLLISLTVGPLAERLLGDAGIGWHIRTGQLILQTRSVPRIDTFSSTMSGKPWYAWEWLYDALAGAIHQAARLNGVVFLSALVIALTFALVFQMMLARGASLPIAVVMLLLAVCASTIHFFTRPHVLSWLFTVIWFGRLDDFEADPKPRRLLWLPLIMLLWVNLHGGFLLGLVLLGIYLVSAWAQKQQWSGAPGGKAASMPARALGMIGALSLVATLANPYHYRLHVHIYRYLTDRFLMDHIDEFLSPNFHGGAQKCFAVLLLLTIVGAAAGRKKLGMSQVMVVAFAVYAGLYSSRNIPISSMLLVLIMAPQISATLAERAASPETSSSLRDRWASFQAFAVRASATESRLRGHVWPILVVVLGVWTCCHQGRIGSRTVIDAHFDGKRFPVKAADFLMGSHIHEPLFCPDNWGGYLIYRLYPQTQVVVDDRHDLYGAEFLKNYLRVVRLEPGWNQALVGMHTNWVLLPKDSAAASLLKEVAEWKSVYQDDTATLFRRVSERSGRE